MKKLIVTTFLALSLTVTAQAADAPAKPRWMTSPAKELVDNARAATKQVSIKDLKTAMDAGEEIVILDVREPAEYDVAHIPGAVNVPRGLLEFSIWSAVPEITQKIFVYCKTGARAALSTKLLNDLGYKEAVSVDTGGKAWVLASYPVQTSISDEEIVIMPVKN